MSKLINTCLAHNMNVNWKFGIISGYDVQHYSLERIELSVI